jgi:hypothetical protein
MKITTFSNCETLRSELTRSRSVLRPHLPWHGAKLEFLAAFLIALLRVRTVSFVELATVFDGKAYTNSPIKLNLQLE